MPEDLLDLDRRCRATSKRSGERCRRFPVRGAAVCYIHGGKSPQAVAKAAQRVAVEAVEADARKVLAHTAVAPLMDPLGEMARLAAEAVAWKDALSQRVNALTEVRYVAPGSGAEQTRAEVSLLERAVDRVAKLLDLMARHDILGRRQALEEAQAAQVTAAVGAGIDAAQLDAGQREAFVEAFLQALGASQAAAEAPGVVRGEIA